MRAAAPASSPIWSSVEILHHGQDELGLGRMQFADVQGHHFAAAVGENREGNTGASKPSELRHIQRILLADEQRIADLELRA